MPEDQTEKTAQDVKQTAETAKGTFQTAKGAVQAVKTAKTGIQAAKAAGTAVKLGAAAGEATNPVGWAMLAVQLAPYLEKFKRLARKIAAGIAALGAYLLWLLGMKILGALVGLAFGAITGLPLLAIPGAGPFLYAGWTAYWGIRGWRDPFGTIHTATHPWELVTKPFAKAWHFVSDSFQGLGGSFGGFAGGITNALGAVTHFATGLAASAWGGITSAAGATLGGLAHVGSSIWGTLTGAGSAVAGNIAAVSTFTAIGAVSIGGILALNTRDASFFNKDADKGGYGESIPPPVESQFITLQKLVSALGKGPATSIQLTNPEGTSGPNLAYTVGVEAKTDITGITCSDELTLIKSDGSKEPLNSLLSPNPVPCPNQLTGGTSSVVSLFNAKLPADNKFQNSLVVNKFTLNGKGVSAGDGGYWIPIRSNIMGANLDQVKQFALDNYSGNLINASCPGGQTCWNYVINQSQAKGANPTFVLAIWYEESHFSAVGNHFSCPASVIETHDGAGLSRSLDCFLINIIDNRPDNEPGFIDAMNQYCGTGPWGGNTPLCENNPNFLYNLKQAYKHLGGIAQPSSGGGGGGGPTTPFTAEATATVTIGTPPATCPKGWPATGAISQGPEGAASHADDAGYGGLEAIDVATPMDTQVYSNLQGRVTNVWLGDSPTNWKISIKPSGCPNLTVVYYLHLLTTNVSVGSSVNWRTSIATSGSAGSGPHVHYQFNGSGDRTFKMESDHIPITVPRTCDSIEACGITITSAPAP